VLDQILSSWNYFAATVWAALINALPVTCIVTGFAWLVLDRVKSWSSTTRCSAWCAVLVFAVLLPLGQAFLPHAIAPPQEDLGPVLALESTPGVDQIAIAQPQTPAPATTLREISGTIIPAHLNLRLPLSPASAFVLFWIMAAAFQFVRLAVALRFTLVLKRSAWPAPDELEARWQRLLKTTYRGRPVTLGISNGVSVPAAIGYRRPVILLPDSTLARLDEEQLDGILIHELAHVRRYDDWAIAIQRILEALFIWHPLVRFIAVKMELQREIACDDWVLSSKQPRAYAFSLAAIAEFCTRSPHSGLMGLAIENQSQLGQRIEVLLDNNRSIATRISSKILGCLACMLSLISLLSLQLPNLMALPVQTDTVKPVTPAKPAVPVAKAAPAPKPAKPVAPAPPKPPRTLSEEQKLSRQEAELARKQAELAKKQAELVRQHIQLADKQISRQLSQQLNLEIHPHIDPQMFDHLQLQMKNLQTQLAHINVDEITKNAMRIQVHMEGLQSRLENMQIRPELKEQLERLRAKQEELSKEQQRNAQELQRTLNEIFNDTVNKSQAKPDR
jgi:beta-lactamase regulating signal transducer with metallopeptidase domain